MNMRTRSQRAARDRFRSDLYELLRAYRRWPKGSGVGTAGTLTPVETMLYDRITDFLDSYEANRVKHRKLRGEE